MGRAGRPKNQHPALRELEEEGLPSGWIDYWQGTRDQILVDSGWSEEFLAAIRLHPVQREIDDLVSEQITDENLFANVWNASLARYGEDLPFDIDDYQQSWKERAHIWKESTHLRGSYGQRPLLPATFVSIPSSNNSAIEAMNEWRRRDPEGFQDFFRKEILPGIRPEDTTYILQGHFSKETEEFWREALRSEAPQLLTILQTVEDSGLSGHGGKAAYIFAWNALSALGDGKSFQEAGGIAAANTLGNYMSRLSLDETLHKKIQKEYPQIAEHIPPSLLRADKNQELWREVIKPALYEQPYAWQQYTEGKKTLEEVFVDFLRRRHG